MQDFGVLHGLFANKFARLNGGKNLFNVLSRHHQEVGIQAGQTSAAHGIRFVRLVHFGKRLGRVVNHVGRQHGEIGGHVFTIAHHVHTHHAATFAPQGHLVGLLHGKGEFLVHVHRAKGTFNLHAQGQFTTEGLQLGLVGQKLPKKLVAPLVGVSVRNEEGRQARGKQGVFHGISFAHKKCWKTMLPTSTPLGSPIPRKSR